MKNVRLASFEYSSAQALLWMSFCVAVSFSAVYLQALGYTNSQLGLVVALGNILVFVLSIFLSSMIDKYPRFSAGDAVYILLAAQLATLLLLWFSGKKGMVTSVSYVLLVGVSGSVSSQLIQQWSDLHASGYPVNFGVARAIGSAGYVVLAAVLGRAVELFSITLLLKTGIVITMLQLLFNAALNRKTTALPSEKGPAAGGSSLPNFLKENRAFTLLLVGLVIIFFAHKVVINFLINIVVDLGGTTASMGYLNAYIAVLEVLPMLVYNRVCRDRDLSRVLGFTLVMFSVKSILFALASSMPMLYVFSLSQMFSFALYTPAIVDYVGIAVPPQDSAKAQTLAYSTSTLGAVFASCFGGMLFDAVSVRSTLFIAAGVCVIGTALSVSALRIKSRRGA